MVAPSTTLACSGGMAGFPCPGRLRRAAIEDHFRLVRPAPPLAAGQITGQFRRRHGEDAIVVLKAAVEIRPSACGRSICSSTPRLHRWANELPPVRLRTVALSQHRAWPPVVVLGSIVTYFPYLKCESAA